MVDLDDETGVNMSIKKKELLSDAMKRTSDWFAFILSSFLSFSFPGKYVYELKNLVSLPRIFFEDLALNSNRIFSQEIPSDVEVHIGGVIFSLHKVKL